MRESCAADPWAWRCGSSVSEPTTAPKSSFIHSPLIHSFPSVKPKSVSFWDCTFRLFTDRSVMTWKTLYLTLGKYQTLQHTPPIEQVSGQYLLTRLWAGYRV